MIHVSSKRIHVFINVNNVYIPERLMFYSPYAYTLISYNGRSSYIIFVNWGFIVHTN